LSYIPVLRFLSFSLHAYCGFAYCTLAGLGYVTVIIELELT